MNRDLPNHTTTYILKRPIGQISFGKHETYHYRYIITIGISTKIIKQRAYSFQFPYFN